MQPFDRNAPPSGPGAAPNAWKPPGRARRALMMLRGVGESARGFRSEFQRLLVVDLALLAVSLVLFVVVAILIGRGATLGVDRGILLWFNAHASPSIDVTALEFTALGSATLTVLVVAVASALLLEARHRYSAALLWVSLVGGWILSRALKEYFDRARPDLFTWRVPHVSSSSYPSGHSVTAMAVYATLAYLVVRLEFSRALRRVTIALFVVIIFLVGVSRVYLGVHFPSDVLGGYLLGFAWAAACVLAVEAIRYHRRKRS